MLFRSGDEFGEAEDCKVPGAVIAQMKAARTCAEEILNDASMVGTFSDIQALMKSNSTLLIALDRSFLLELKWPEQHGDEAFVEAVHRKIMECFPTTSASLTLNQSALKLDDLMGSEMVKFSSARCQNEIKTIKRLVATTMQGVSPKESFAAGGGIFKQVLDALPNFLRVPATPKTCYF